MKPGPPRRTLRVRHATPLGAAMIAAIAASASLDPAPVVAAIYGVDSRRVHPVGDYETQLAEMSFAVVPTARIRPEPGRPGFLAIRGSPASDEFRLCDSEPYASAVSVAVCSALLVKPSLAVTAKHCVRDGSDTSIALVRSQVIRDEFRTMGPRGYLVPRSSVFLPGNDLVEVHEVPHLDIAFIGLSRDADAASPLPLCDLGHSPSWLVGAGHSLGVALTLYDAHVGLDSPGSTLFFASADASVGASGGGLIDATAGCVAGIFLGGRRDFALQPGGCNRSRVYPRRESGERILGGDSVRDALSTIAD